MYNFVMKYMPLGLFLVAALAQSTDAQIDAGFYTSKVKPLLKEKCIACHGPVRSEAGLRLDTAANIMHGSGEGPILTIEHPDDSKILKRVLEAAPSDRMPPEGEGVALLADEVAVLRDWILHRTPSPEREDTIAGPVDHWAFQPILKPKLPTPTATALSAVDGFIAIAQRDRDMTPLPEADRLTLLRRITLDLTGLPPAFEEIQSFLADQNSDAYERHVDLLLSRSSYGERWGRHWMDVWRYSDWDGYKEEVRGSQRNIWHWRDWIIESLNEDKPYDQMIVEMLAGDEIDPLNDRVLRATGFLARNYHKSNRNIWLDATVEHTAKAFVGLTINCAKCHDHKYDPLSQADYYRFRAIFEPHRVRTDPVLSNSPIAKTGFPRAYDADLSAETFLFVRGDDKQPIKDQPIASSIPLMLPIPISFSVSSIPLPIASYLPELTPEVERAAIEKALKKCDEMKMAIEQAGFALHEIATKPDASADSSQSDLTFAMLKLSEAEASLTSIKLRYAADKAKYIQSDAVANERLAADALAAEQRWKEIESELRVATATRALMSAEKSQQKDEKKRTVAIDKAKKELTAAEVAHKKWVAADSSGTLKEYTPVAIRYPKESTGRRLALARWIVDRQNPLTARVAVNHIWSRHFGTPLVDNVFDFGMKTPKPELLEILDWLAAEFIESGWDMKHLHRILVRTQAYRRASSGSPEHMAVAQKTDPDNQLYWRGNVRRLDAEEVRDSVLAVGQILDDMKGGPDISEDDGEKNLRRSVYFRHAYEKQMTMMVMFDAASPNECYRRRPSVIPQQALVLANSQLARSSSRKLALRIWKESGQVASTFVQRLFMETLNRSPYQHELDACLSFLTARTEEARNASDSTSKPEPPKPEPPKPEKPQSAPPKSASEPPASDPIERACQSLAHVMLNHNDFISVR